MSNSVRKAGKSRHLGRRPKVRGVVMNPVDHPHGGGEGRTLVVVDTLFLHGELLQKALKQDKNKRTNVFIVKRRKNK